MNVTFFVFLCAIVGQAGTSEDGSGGSSVGLMITLALFFHKAPEAAGYGTFLVHMNGTTCERASYLAVSIIMTQS